MISRQEAGRHLMEIGIPRIGDSLLSKLRLTRIHDLAELETGAYCRNSSLTSSNRISGG
jgi:hypothetical protein